MNRQQQDPGGPDTTDEAAAALRAGDRQAIADLFDRHYGEAYALGARLLGDRQAAADAVQDAFLRVLRYRKTYAARGTFRAWLLRVVRNCCLEHARASQREQEVTGRLPPNEPTHQPADPDPRLARLKRLLGALPWARKEALVLRLYHELSYADIGWLCGISEGAARVRVHRALEGIRRDLTSHKEADHD